MKNKERNELDKLLKKHLDNRRESEDLYNKITKFVMESTVCLGTDDDDEWVIIEILDDLNNHRIKPNKVLPVFMSLYFLNYAMMSSNQEEKNLVFALMEQVIDKNKEAEDSSED